MYIHKKTPFMPHTGLAWCRIRRFASVQLRHAKQLSPRDQRVVRCSQGEDRAGLQTQLKRFRRTLTVWKKTGVVANSHARRLTYGLISSLNRCQQTVQQLLFVTTFIIWYLSSSYLFECRPNVPLSPHLFFKRWGSNLFDLWDRGALTTNKRKNIWRQGCDTESWINPANVHWLQSDFSYLPSMQKTILSAINKRCKCLMSLQCLSLLEKVILNSEAVLHKMKLNESNLLWHMKPYTLFHLRRKGSWSTSDEVKRATEMLWSPH